jgi:hypothetical protein
MADEYQFTTPSGRPAKVNATTQNAIDRWHRAGMKPPPPKPGESQYFYATRIGNSLTNRERGYYGEDVSTERMFDKRETPAPSPNAVKDAARGRNTLAKQMVSLRGSTKVKPSGVYATLLGMGAIANRRTQGR